VLVHPLLAGIVVATFEDGVRKLDASICLEHRKITLGELILKCFGRGSDYDSSPTEYCWHEIAKTFADTGTRLDRDRLSFGHRGGDTDDHLALTLAVFGFLV
jgi:hypothetical protein